MFQKLVLQLTQETDLLFLHYNECKCRNRAVVAVAGTVGVGREELRMARRMNGRAGGAVASGERGLAEYEWAEEPPLA